jgi:hypothetical protein
MAFWTMNLGIDTTNATLNANGEFVDYVSNSSPLQSSKRWLQSPTAPAPNVTFSMAPFANPGHPQGLQASMNDDIWVRIFPLNQFPANYTVDWGISVVFGRKPGSTQPFRAPFVLQPGFCKTVIDSASCGPTWPDGSMLAELGTVANPTPAGSKYTYVFIVGLTLSVTPPGGTSTAYSYGHDPEMEVGNTSR